jgi:predicted O-methyltransferase YrrM
MLDDALFLRFARGEENPGDLTGLPHHDSEDMAGNLPILYALARGMGGRSLEIGVDDGTSTLALLKAADEVGGSVVSVDDGRSGHLPCARALAERFGYRHLWTLVCGDSRTLTLARQRNFDLALVDGDHTEAGASSDIAVVAPLLRPGGLLLVHDCHVEPVAAAVAASLPAAGWSRVVLPMAHPMAICRRR